MSLRSSEDERADAVHHRSADDPDAPRCPGCGYSLVGLLGSSCPECGCTLAADREQYQPSRSATPWSRDTPRPLPRGVVDVVLHPVRTLQGCSSVRRVTTGRGVAFALTCSVATILLWGLIRDAGACLAISLGSRSFSADLWQRLVITKLKAPFGWRHVVVWEAWAILRWWLLFAIVTLVLPAGAEPDVAAPSRGRLPARGVRLLLFAPWITILEVLFLSGVWVYEANILPEPSTIFTSWPMSLAQVLTHPIWIIRAAPSLVVGIVFFRAVMRWRWPASIVGAIAFAPVAILLSVAWSLLFRPIGIARLAYGF